MIGIRPIRGESGKGLANRHGQWLWTPVGISIRGIGGIVIIVEQIKLVVHVFVRVWIFAPGNKRPSWTADEGHIRSVSAKGADGSEAFNDSSSGITAACIRFAVATDLLILFLLSLALVHVLVLPIVQSAVQGTDAAIHGSVASSVVLGGRTSVGR